MEFKLLCDKFEKQLGEIEILPSNIVTRSTTGINLSRDILHSFKKRIIKSDFKLKSDEIIFFKQTKQIPLIPLIYYSEIRSFELQFPKGNMDCQRKYIKKKINKLNRFFLYNMDFIQYIESGFTHFDEHYFTRDFLEDYHITSSKFYFQDPDFSTSRDMLLGKVKAYNKFIIYLQNRMLQTITVKINPQSATNYNPNLKWTSSKSALTELIYALHHSRVINNGNVEIKDIALSMQYLFNIDLTDFYKTYLEIKSRKKSRTKFLDKLSTNLISQMDNSEE